MTEDKDFKIAELKALLAQKEAEEAPEEVYDAIIEPTPVSAAPKRIILPGEPFVHQRAPRPESLRGMSAMEMELSFLDGTMSEEEIRWWNSRNRPVHFTGGELAWMR